jgi:hypothetical protein
MRTLPRLVALAGIGCLMGCNGDGVSLDAGAQVLDLRAPDFDFQGPVDLGCKSTDGDCHLMGYCLDDGRCVECRTSDDCPNDGHCDPASHACRCDAQHGCDPIGAPICLVDFGYCVGCILDEDCHDPGAPVCWRSYRMCISCLLDDDRCGPGKHCANIGREGAHYVCVECESDSDCPPPDAGGGGRCLFDRGYVCER